MEFTVSNTATWTIAIRRWPVAPPPALPTIVQALSFQSVTTSAWTRVAAPNANNARTAIPILRSRMVTSLVAREGGDDYAPKKKSGMPEDIPLAARGVERQLVGESRRAERKFLRVAGMFHNPLISRRFFCPGYISLDNRCLSNYITGIAGGAQPMTIYDTASYEFRSGVPQLIGRIRAAYITELEERLAPFNLNAADYFVLVSVANDIDTASAVCTLMAHDPGAMTRKIDALEERGPVRRGRSADDPRATRPELTPA